MSEFDLPLVNAVLNGTAVLLLLFGYAAIRTKRVPLHKSLMLTALAVSATFLASYLYYHFAVRRGEETRYIGGWSLVYYGVLSSHILLAIVTVPLALTTAWLALRGRFHTHRKLARWTFPIWLYVSVTGVLVYLFLRGHYPTT